MAYTYKEDEDEVSKIIKTKGGKRSMTTTRKSKGRDKGKLTGIRRSEDIDVGGKKRGQVDFSTDYTKAAGSKGYGKKSTDASIEPKKGRGEYSKYTAKAMSDKDTGKFDSVKPSKKGIMDQLKKFKKFSPAGVGGASNVFRAGGAGYSGSDDYKL